MRIDIAHKSDAALVLQKVAERITELVGEPYFFDTLRVLQSIEEAIGDGRYTALLTKDAAGEVIAVLTFGEAVAAYAGGRFGIIHEFHVLPEHRSAGIGKSMLETAKAICRERDWARLEVGAPPYPQ